MDGKTLLTQLDAILDEDSNSAWMDDLLSYQFINEGAVEFVRRTECNTGEQSITTVAEQRNYALSGKFMNLYLKNHYHEYFIKYNDGSNNHFLTWKPYEQIILGDQSTSVSVPSHFTIRDKTSFETRLTSTAKADGAATAGECTLYDTSAAFTTTISEGDIVHNTGDGSRGYVLSISADNTCKTALFKGTNNDWSNLDAYTIQPQARYELYLDPPPSTAGHTITVFYVERPRPVYSDYGIFRFPQHHSPPLVSYAAWKYKYKDKEPNYGDKWYMAFENSISKFKNEVNNVRSRNYFQVNLKANRNRIMSY